MKKLRNINENEMVAVFLLGEFTSERFSDAIHKELASLKLHDSVITNPNIDDVVENQARRQILSSARGYDQRTDVFGGFPRDVKWTEAELSKDELKHVKYINYSYWNELTNGSRLPKDAVATIDTGREVFGVSNDRFIQAAEAVRAGKQFPTMIFAGEEQNNLVALEGHLRLTAYALAWNNVPDKIKVIIGISPHMTEWGLY